MRNIIKRESKKHGTVYQIRISLGYSSDGRQIRKSMTYIPPTHLTAKQLEKELERQAILFEEKIKNGLSIDTNIKFSDYAEKFMTVKELSPICRSRYYSLLDRINQAIGHIRLSKLKPIHLQEFYKDLKKVISRKTGEPLSDKTILHHHRLISSILTQATREQIIPRNIAAREFMEAPKAKHNTPKYLDDVQAQELVRLLNDEADIRVKTALLLLIYSGMRRGELCGLEWSDIDFKNNLLHVRRASQYISGEGLITKNPKNESSIRAMKLPNEVFSMMNEYRIWQAHEKLKNGDRWKHILNIKMPHSFGYHIDEMKNDRIFTTDDGGLISPDTINFWLNQFIKKHDLPRITPHSLRHTNITLQIAAGVSIRTIAARAGHSQVSTTTNIYSHAIQSADEAASEALNGILALHTN